MTRQARAYHSEALRVCVPLAVIAVLASARSAAASDVCAAAFSHDEVVAAISDIQSSTDPCGETGEIRALIARFRVCAQSGYAVCINRQADRNSTDVSQDQTGNHVFITWNPDLQTELESGCAGDPHRRVMRDPNSSLLHEIAHVVQDCAGLDPNAHELEAVRLENIYRRARHLCQRTVYGEQRLPATMIVGCEPGHCLCTGASPQFARRLKPDLAHPTTTAGDAASLKRH